MVSASLGYRASGRAVLFNQGVVEDRHHYGDGDCDQYPDDGHRLSAWRERRPEVWSESHHRKPRRVAQEHQAASPRRQRSGAPGATSGCYGLGSRQRNSRLAGPARAHDLVFREPREPLAIKPGPDRVDGRKGPGRQAVPASLRRGRGLPPRPGPLFTPPSLRGSSSVTGRRVSLPRATRRADDQERGTVRPPSGNALGCAVRELRPAPVFGLRDPGSR